MRRPDRLDGRASKPALRKSLAALAARESPLLKIKVWPFIFLQDGQDRTRWCFPCSAPVRFRGLIPPRKPETFELWTLNFERFIFVGIPDATLEQYVIVGRGRSAFMKITTKITDAFSVAACVRPNIH
jgi:hypothetical protein